MKVQTTESLDSTTSRRDDEGLFLITRKQSVAEYVFADQPITANNVIRLYVYFI